MKPASYTYNVHIVCLTILELELEQQRLSGA